MKIYLDATTLIALGTVGELDLLTRLSGDLVVPSQVRAEVTTEPAATNLDRFIAGDEVMVEAESDEDRLSQAMTVLGEETENGDVHIVAAVLAATAEDRPVGVVSDDRRVRTTAQGLGATVTGTVGVVVRAVEEGLDPASAKALVERIDSHGLHMTASLREKAYTLIEEAASGAE